MSTIIGVPVSPYVRKTMLAHWVKKIPFEVKPVTPGSDDETFRAASPLGKIPAYQSAKGTLFSDSSVIISYIEREHTEVPLYPTNNENYAKALWLEEYSDTKLSETASALYFQRIIGPAFFEHQTDENRVNEVINELLPPVLDFLETQLNDAHYFIGERISVADIAIGSNLMSLERANYLLDNDRWPKLVGFYRNFITLDATKKQKSAEDQVFNR